MLIRPTMEKLENDDFEIIPLDESDDTNNIHVPIRLFVEFKSKSIRGINAITRFNNFITSSDIFTKLSNDVYQANIVFPYRNSERLISLIANVDKNNHNIQLSLYHDNKIFLVILGTYKNEIIIKRGLDSKAKSQWSNEDIEDIFDCINQYIKSDVTMYYDELAKLIKSHFNYSKHNGRFSLNDLSELTKHYKNYSMNYRINHAILKNSNYLNDKYQFTIDWLDSSKNSHSIKAVFSVNDKFFNPAGKNPGYSWVMTENILLSKFSPYKENKIKPGINYYSLQLYELIQGESIFEVKESQLLDIWFTMDGLYGELHKLKKGHTLTGNDVLTLYLLFDNLFRIKTTFINDVSAIEDKKHSLSVPLRLISALTTGYTWYQSKIPGLSLFNADKFETSANGEISQDSFARNRALKELQNFRVYEWYNILPSEDKLKLCDIYNRNIKKVFPEVISDVKYRTRSAISLVDLFDKNLTIQRFAEVIYHSSKEQKCVTYDLNMLTYLLVGKVDELERVTNLNGSDAWVKTRANQLLYGSTFWVKSCDNSSNMFKNQFKNSI